MKKFFIIPLFLMSILCSCSKDDPVMYDIEYVIAGGDSRSETELQIKYLCLSNDTIVEKVSFSIGHNIWKKKIYGVPESFTPYLSYKEIKGGNNPGYAIGIETTGKSSVHTEYLPKREGEITISINPL